MWRRQSIGILLFLSIVTMWAIFYSPGQSSFNWANQVLAQYVVEGSRLALPADEAPNSPAVRGEEPPQDGNKENVDYCAHLESRHREVLREWLKRKPYLRPAVYYSKGDLNHDGNEDFAVLLVDSRKYPDEIDRFALAIFNAPFRRGDFPAYFEDDLQSISNKYVVFDPVGERYLFLDEFERDALCATYYPKGKTYYFKDCEY